MRSQNGWTASENRADLNLTPLIVNGVGFLPGVRGGDVHTVLGYVAQQVNDRVEKAVNPGCWGYNFRANRNDPNALSNHSSATAIDFNAPKHPNGVPTGKTWTPEQVAEIHTILAEVNKVVRWGGDYHFTPDAMHFEIDADAAAVAAVAKKIREDAMPKPKPVAVGGTVTEQGRAKILAGVNEVSAGIRLLWTVPKSRRFVWVMAAAVQVGNKAIRAALKAGPTK